MSDIDDDVDTDDEDIYDKDDVRRARPRLENDVDEPDIMII